MKEIAKIDGEPIVIFEPGEVEFVMKAISKGAKNFLGEVKNVGFHIRQKRKVSMQTQKQGMKEFDILLAANDLSSMEWFKEGVDFK